MPTPAEILALAANVELVIFDVDGVLTDGRIILGPEKQEFKHFDVRDGLGMVMLRKSGVPIAIITGRESAVVDRRMQELGIDLVFQGRSNKLATFEQLLANLGVAPSSVCYVGDDLPDIPLLRRVGLPVAVADANWRVHEFAAYVTAANGGRGAAREICELIMNGKGSLAEQQRRIEDAALPSATNG